MLAIRRPLCSLRLATLRSPLAYKQTIHRPFATTLRRRQDREDATTVVPSAGELDITKLRLEFTEGQREEFVRLVREEWEDNLPEGLLSDKEFAVYERMYGKPIRMLSKEELASSDRFEGDVEAGSITLENADGTEIVDEVYEEEEVEVEVYSEEEAAAYRRLGKDIEVAWSPERALQEAEQEFENEEAESEEDIDRDPEFHGDRRTHPLTAIGKFKTFPKIAVPPQSITGPTSELLAKISNIHLDKATYRLLGTRIEHSPITTSKRGRRSTKLPIDTTTSKMTDMDSNVFLATIMPGYYAQALSALTELRKRLGGEWVLGGEGEEQGVKRVMDIGGGGAGIFAWRDIVEAEKACRQEEASIPGNPPIPESESESESETPPLKSTVICGSDPLRYRLSKFLENTTFLPRLPESSPLHAEPANENPKQPRKYYDLIIATNTVIPLYQPFQRKNHIDALWSLLNPKGGILLLIEKGTPPGFEAVAMARDRLLTKYIGSPGSMNRPATSPQSFDEPILKETGAIIAPCTNHAPCPMFATGETNIRKDWCRFPQRYERPDYMQRILKATDKNHEDLEYSYVAVRRGIDYRKQQEAEKIDPKEEEFNVEATPLESPYSLRQLRLHSLTYPRAILPPMKRHGHVIIDVCSPAGKIERWTVPKSYSRAAFRDARKCRWGDLWGLGAKTKIPRKVKFGNPKGEYDRKKLVVNIYNEKGVKEKVEEKDLPGGKKRNPGKRERERREAKREAQKVGMGSSRSWGKEKGGKRRGGDEHD
ncbi:37S ribosomal protein S22 [Rhizina undulata]